MNVRELFSKAMKEQSERLNLTQQEIEERSGVTQGLISKIMNGKMTPGLDNAVKLAKVLKIDLSKLT